MIHPVDELIVFPDGVLVGFLRLAPEYVIIVLPACFCLVSQVKGMLQAQSWEPIVQVNEADEQVQMFMKADGEGMQGLTVMAVDANEAVFLNILGAIDPDKVGAVMKQFDVDVDVQ